jgi:hypothetical protein
MAPYLALGALLCGNHRKSASLNNIERSAQRLVWLSKPGYSGWALSGNTFRPQLDCADVSLGEIRTSAGSRTYPTFTTPLAHAHNDSKYMSAACRCMAPVLLETNMVDRQPCMMCDTTVGATQLDAQTNFVYAYLKY